MRLGTCIALELVVAAGSVSALVLGVGRAVDVAGDYFSTHEAAAAAPPPPSRQLALVPLPGAELHVAAPAAEPTVFDGPDELLLAPLAATPVTAIKLNHGGTSLSLRVEFASGARAAFKPQQIHPQSDPRKEIAAYRIDRLLGIGHVSPAKPVAFTMDALVAAADPATRDYTAGRLQDEAIAKDGIVRGELQWWIPEIRDVMMGGYRVDEKAGMEIWEAYLQVGVAIPPDVRPMVAQLAACVLFDVLIDNADRWTGNNTKGSVDGKTLYFMDNTLSFSQFTLGHATNLAPLYKIQVFPRGLVARMRALTADQLERALSLGDDPAGMGPLLQPGEIQALLGRRDHLMQYIDALVAELGENQVLALP
ncbi:MAG TPA: hypothetical protein VMJ10_26330 [Kofleriaceae bacterium]|nr:hypothetical protein [Kofleriaceae bacterium]